MTRVFLDTVGLLALWEQRDQWHDGAVAGYERHRLQDVEKVTTSFILLECGNAAARRPYRNEVDLLRDQLEQAESLIHPTAQDWSLAWKNYREGDVRSAGIVDHVSFVVMRRLGITRVFSNDGHFRAAGFETLF